MIPNIESVKWDDASEKEDGSRLLATIQILGCAMHLTALEVYWEDTPLKTQTGMTPEIEDEFNDLYKATGSGDPWDQVKINGRDYVLYAYPFNNGTVPTG